MPAASTMSTDSSSAALFSPFIPLGVSTPLHNPTSSSSTRELLMQSTMSANSIMASSGVGSNHGSPSSGIAVMIGNTMIGSGNTTSAGIGSNWRMDRSRQLIRQREHEEAENQLDLAEQWLATHIMKVAAQKRHPLN
ncbi:hypothetical protein HDE_14197 [Halotydeus destructor]|nr:hypothetical protein HDE_14197 [Halotydeus destructor]